MPCSCCLYSAVRRRYQEHLPPWTVILIKGWCAYPPVLSRIFERKMEWKAVAPQCDVAIHDLCSQLKVQAIRTLESLAGNAQDGSGTPLCLSVLPLPSFFNRGGGRGPLQYYSTWWCKDVGGPAGPTLIQLKLASQIHHFVGCVSSPKPQGQAKRPGPASIVCQCVSCSYMQFTITFTEDLYSFTVVSVVCVG